MVKPTEDIKIFSEVLPQSDGCEKWKNKLCFHNKRKEHFFTVYCAFDYYYKSAFDIICWRFNHQ